MATDLTERVQEIAEARGIPESEIKCGQLFRMLLKIIKYRQNNG